MNLNFELIFSIRYNLGKIYSKLYRKKNKIPGIIYGPYLLKSIYIIIDSKELLKIKNIIYPILNINKLKNTNIILKNNNNNNYFNNVIIKEVQYHPYKKQIKHIDFLFLNKI